MEANANATGDATAEKSEEVEGIKSETILEAIEDMKADFSNRFDGILVAIEGVRKEIGECTERITGAEVCISNTEDDMVSLQAKVRSLEDKKRELEDKVTDLEARSRRSNLTEFLILVNI